MTAPIVGGQILSGAIFLDQDYFLRLLDRCFPASWLTSIKVNVNSGYEQFQAAAKWGERVSQAIQRLENGALLLSASGGSFATGQVTFQRSSVAFGAITLLAGTVVGTSSGRKFVTTEQVVFGATDLGPYTVRVQAIAVGWEYNLPGDFTTPSGIFLAGEITEIVKLKTYPWQVFTVAPGGTLVTIVGNVLPSFPNVGDPLNIVPTAPVNGALVLNIQIATAPAFGGGNTTFHLSSAIDATTTGGLIADTTMDAPPIDPNMTVSQPVPTTGGADAMLDMLGSDLLVFRKPGESDDRYRLRILQSRDTVSPDAIQRGLDQLTASVGGHGCLREVGTVKLQGFFYDAGSSADAPQFPVTNYAYDMDFVARPADRFKLYLDFESFRGYFLVGLPTVEIRHFGLFYDGSSVDLFPLQDAYDTIGVDVGDGAYDGFQLLDAGFYQGIFDMLNAKRAGGVGFDLYLETIGCTP